MRPEKTEKDVMSKIGDILFLANCPTPKLRAAIARQGESELDRYAKVLAAKF
jgi:hypothetical protein